jgi:FYVE/RhoGEF/PH domain-containing protein 5/6
MPLILSLESPSPLLTRAELTSIFSNFIDIWNFHRSFFSSLSSLLFRQNSNPTPTSSSSEPSLPPTLPQFPPLSPLLSAHFPYLSLYTPFITSFPTTISSLSTLSFSNPIFGEWLKGRERDERCGKLALRDWLLSIVQRCPRYLLLLKVS